MTARGEATIEPKDVLIPVAGGTLSARLAAYAVEPHRLARAHAYRVLAFADECRLHRERGR
jgi:hypothetical protein